MTIEKKMNGTALEIALEGRLDTMTSPELEAELKQSMPGAESLTRVLLSAHKAMSAKGGMKVTHVNEVIGEVFEVTGFADILTIEN